LYTSNILSHASNPFIIGIFKSKIITSKFLREL